MLKIIRLPITLLIVILSSTIGFLISLFRPFHPNNIQWTAKFLRLGRFTLGMNIIVRKKEIMEKNNPCVIISNHQDNLDIFAGCMSIPPRTVTIGKQSILFIPFFGLFYWLSGNILINRKNKRSAFETMDVAANKIKNNNMSVWIMPEGTRSKGRGLLPFKKGPFVTAIKAQVPIVPVAWSNYSQIIDLNKWHSCTILVEALEPISTEGKTLDDVNDIKEKAFEMMKKAIDKLDQEVAEASKQKVIIRE
jgi:1-acyl-sn-glycerol-3-phosphate acyltransferase